MEELRLRPLVEHETHGGHRVDLIRELRRRLAPVDDVRKPRADRLLPQEHAVESVARHGGLARGQGVALWLLAELDGLAFGAVDEVVFWMADEGRLGRKSNAGFYDYDDKGKRSGLWSGLGDKYPAAADQPDLQTVQNRLMMAQVLEAVHALEEGVLEDIREGDVGAILGWGFAPWSGGPFSWLDMIGAAKAVEICESLAGQGPRFKTPDLLAEMAAKGQTFYGRFGNAARAVA